MLLLAGVASWRSHVVSQSCDPGLTTELALFITCLMGVLAVAQPALGAGAALAVSWAQTMFGETGLLAGVALAAPADAQSALPALSALHTSGQASTATVLLCVLLCVLFCVLFCVLMAVSTNALTRTATAIVTGGAGFGLRLALSLLASTRAAWGAAAIFR